MPNAALKPCAYPGCGELVKRGCCARHTRQRANLYRDKAAQRLYDTTRWRQLRVAQLTREPWCAACLSHLPDPIYTQATDVDHVVQHHNDPRAFFAGQLQSLCHSCHSRKTANEVFRKGEGASESFRVGPAERRGPSA